MSVESEKLKKAKAKAKAEMKETERKLNMLKISGLELIPLAESYSIHEAENPIHIKADDGDEAFVEASAKGMARLQKWPDKPKAQAMFFKNSSYEGYGKLSDPEVIEKIADKEGLLKISELFFLCFQYYVGGRLSGPDTEADQDRKD